MLFILNENLDTIHEMYPHEIHPCEPSDIMSFSESFDKTSLILSVDAEPDESQYNGMYSGSQFDFNSWITKVTLDAKTNKLTTIDPSKTSTLVKKEAVYSILEIAAGKLLAYLYNKDVLVIESWSLIHRVVESDATSLDKYQIIPLKLSDESNFAVLSGNTSINILNVGTKLMSPLVQTKATCYTGQSAMFISKEENGF